MLIWHLIVPVSWSSGICLIHWSGMWARGLVIENWNGPFAPACSHQLSLLISSRHRLNVSEFQHFCGVHQEFATLGESVPSQVSFKSLVAYLKSLPFTFFFSSSGNASHQATSWWTSSGTYLVLSHSSYSEVMKAACSTPADVMIKNQTVYTSEAPFRASKGPEMFEISLDLLHGLIYLSLTRIDTQ